jgi:hypothetical protein
MKLITTAGFHAKEKAHKCTKRRNSNILSYKLLRFLICYASKKYGNPGFVTAARASHCQQKFNWTVGSKGV